MATVDSGSPPLWTPSVAPMPGVDQPIVAPARRPRNQIGEIPQLSMTFRAVRPGVEATGEFRQLNISVGSVRREWHNFGNSEVDRDHRRRCMGAPQEGLRSEPGANDQVGKFPTSDTRGRRQPDAPRQWVPCRQELNKVEGSKPFQDGTASHVCSIEQCDSRSAAFFAAPLR